MPLLQDAPWPQVVPQEPQLPESALRSAHTFPQFVSPPGQTHTPLTHAPPSGQSASTMQFARASVEEATTALTASSTGSRTDLRRVRGNGARPTRFMGIPPSGGLDRRTPLRTTVSNGMSAPPACLSPNGYGGFRELTCRDLYAERGRLSSEP